MAQFRFQALNAEGALLQGTLSADSEREAARMLDRRGLSVVELASAITLQESGRLTRIPGIGKKTAERLLLELKGKLGADLGPGGGAPLADASSDILNALLALGYSDKEAVLAMKQVPAASGVSEGIKLALKALSKG